MKQMNHRFTYRPSPKVRCKINQILQLKEADHKRTNITQILNAIVLNRLNKIHITPKDINNIRSRYSNKNYQKLVQEFENGINALNITNRILRGGFNNLNQLTKKINENEINVDPNDFKKYKRLMISSLISVQSEEAYFSKIWQKM